MSSSSSSSFLSFVVVVFFFLVFSFSPFFHPVQEKKKKNIRNKLANQHYISPYKRTAILDRRLGAGDSSVVRGTGTRD